MVRIFISKSSKFWIMRIRVWKKNLEISIKINNRSQAMKILTRMHMVNNKIFNKSQTKWWHLNHKPKVPVNTQKTISKDQATCSHLMAKAYNPLKLIISQKELHLINWMKWRILSCQRCTVKNPFKKVMMPAQTFIVIVIISSNSSSKQQSNNFSIGLRCHLQTIHLIW